MAQALGFDTAETQNLHTILSGFRLIYNTIPQMILPKEQTLSIAEDCTLIARISGTTGNNVSHKSCRT